MRLTPPPGAKPRWPGDIPVDPIFAWIARSKVGLAIGLGILFRLASYFPGRGFWMDEGRLVANIRTLTPAGFFGPLYESQLAPPGFLLTVWATIQVFGGSTYALRLVPLLAGIAGLFLFRAVAWRVLPIGAVFPAVLMLAVANDPVYYSGEVKQYSSDLAATLALLLMGLTIGSRPLSAAGTASLATVGAAIVWFSHPSIFVLTSVGLVGVSQTFARKDGRGVALWVIIGVIWVTSFVAVHAVANRQLGGSKAMWVFWDFAFPPMPPRSVWDATWFARRLMYFLVNPLNFNAPIGERFSMIPALGMALLGTFRLWKLDRARLALLVLPVALTLLAATLHLYPFHGRLVLFLIPIPLIAIAAGLDWIGELRGRGLLYYALATMVLVAPGVLTFQELSNGEPSHNRFGDMHPYDLDPYRFPF